MRAEAGRTRNARGSGDLLRTEIVTAARAILIEEGHEAAITLRGVARRVGITAPSIYAHFAGPDEIVQAVVVDAFGQLRAVIDEAVAGLVDPIERYVTGCRAYITFGLENPNLYKVLFDRNRLLGGQRSEGHPPAEDDLRRAPFHQLLAAVEDCMRAGVSSAHSAPATALEVWVAMHGLVALRGQGYQVPWPPRHQMEPPFLLALARIRDGAGSDPDGGGP